MRSVEKMMSPRMLMIAQAVEPCKKIFDTGTDHAFVPIYLIEHEICESAVASDVRIGPVRVAEKNIAKFNAGEKISTSLCDGIKNAKGCDCIIVAGMGGQLICDILARETVIAQEAEQLVLQPMNAPEKLRKYLWDSGFVINSENLCREKHKVYNVICAGFTGEKTQYEEVDLHASKYLVNTNHPLLKGYLKPKIKRLSDMLGGGNDPGSQNSRLLTEIEELVK